MQIEKVLIVDDDDYIRRIGQLSLSKVGKWQVLLADCGRQGLELCRQYQPDVILLDVMMPGMDGPTALKLIKEQASTANTPVIFMTAKVLKHEIDSYREMGAAGVIPKPFDPLALPQQIQSIVAIFAAGEPLCPAH